MKLLFDTNIIIDIILKRDMFFDDSFSAIEKAIKKGDRVFMSPSAITDIYYLVKKAQGKAIADESLITLSEIFDFATVDGNCIINAIYSKIADFEDAVVESCALSEDIEYIITRNVKDFINSRVCVLSPKEFFSLEK